MSGQNDRAFLDVVTDRTLELKLGKMNSYKGNYSFFEKESVARKEQLRKAYDNQRKEIQRQKDFINRFRSNVKKASMVQSRIKALEKMGFLTVGGGSLIALDGQHRLKALKEVVNSGNEYPGPYLNDVVNDELCVLFIEHEDFIKTRRIFNKVNRHVKPTSAADNIITSEDDGYSIITRWLVEDEGPLGLPKEFKGPF